MEQLHSGMTIGRKHDRGEYLMGLPSEIDKEVEKPEERSEAHVQRPLDPQKVEEIYKSQKDEIAKGGILILDALSLCKYKNKYYLIDGQHRLAAFLKLVPYGNRLPKGARKRRY